jgi:hypothetical protein
MNMKTIIALNIFILMTMLPIASAETFADLEVQQFLDSAMPNFEEEVLVVGRYFAEYNRDVYSLLLSTVFEIAGKTNVLNAGLEQQLTVEAESFLTSFFGGLPCENWGVVINLNRRSVKSVTTAGSFGANEDGGFTVDPNANNVLAGGFQVMTGNNISIGNETFKVAGAVNFSPIMLDIDGNGQVDSNRNEWKPHAPTFYGERTALFDMSGDFRNDFIEWIGSRDALLVMPEKDGSVKSAHNLFGTAGGYKDGYQKMALVLDTDKNGVVEGDELAGLYLWQDANGNARAEKGEMRTVQEVGVEKINVAHRQYESTCVIKGKEVKTWDWWPSCYELMKVKETK